MGSTPPQTRSTILAAAALTAALACCSSACKSLRVHEEGTVPFELYDSPVVASVAPDYRPTARTRADGTSRAAARRRARRKERRNAPPPTPAARRGPPPKDWNGDPDQKAVNADDAGASTSGGDSSGSSDRKRRGGAYTRSAAYVAAVYKINGVEFSEEQRSSIPAMYRRCRTNHATFSNEKPQPGDLAFFHNTVDANEDGRNNDWYTHVALVESVDGGVVTLLGYRDGEVRSFKMNPEQPDATRTRHGKTANSRIRPKRDDDPPFTQHLAGQLFAGYCALLGDKKELIVIDNWRPGMKVEAPEGR